MNILSGLGQIFNQAINVRRHYVPPNVRNTRKNGVEIYEKQEKDLFCLEKKRCLQTNIVPHFMVGIRKPQVRNIETALSESSSLIPSSVFSGFAGGGAMSLGGLLSGLISNNMMKKATNKMPQEVQIALTSVVSLLPEVQGAPGYPTDTMVHPETYMQNAVGLLSQVTHTTDLFNTLNRLQTDSSLFGLDKLGTMPLNIASPFGNFTKSFDAFGQISGGAPQAIQSLISAFSSLMSAGSFGIRPGQIMFGESAPVIGRMMNSLSSSAMSQIVSRVQSINIGGKIPISVTNFGHMGNLPAKVGAVLGMS